jgi:anti-anti-sigma regulatory factor
MAKYKLFDVELHGEISVVRWTAEVLSRTLGEHEMVNEIERFLAREATSRVVVSFSRLAHCNSEVIGGLISLKKRLDRAGQRLAVCDINETLRDKLRQLNLLRILEIHGALEAAITALRVPDQPREAGDVPHIQTGGHECHAQ